ncbi:endonuclease/exonuclease/phosphatase family protein [Xenophilus sp.]|uniref:endonuclease/exonuclease/phosphatase family protein n=3 Tax=Xenophilus sp. TaxID=1873499 RepID=UPI0037DDC588
MRIVTWNTQWCCGLDGTVSPRRIVEGARALADFDVLCLQEIAQGYDDTMPGRPGDQPAELAALLPGHSLFFGAAVDEFTPGGRRQRFGNLIATRLPVRRVEHHPLPWPADAGVRSMPRMCTVVTVDAPGLGPVRVMTTHLEYYSPVQRMAQARALRALHQSACALAAAPPAADEDGSPFRAKPHTPHAVLCGDFNLGASEPEYEVIRQPFDAGAGEARLHDAWRVMHGEAPHPPTFRLFDRTYGPDPVACDFVFLSDGLAPRLKSIAVDTATRVSDHQPVAIELA